MRVGYLTGELVYLRPPVEEDVDFATAWFPSPYPINATRAKTELEEHPGFWYDMAAFTLIIVRSADDQVAGGLSVSTSGRRDAFLRFHMAPTLEDAGTLRADAVRVVVPWLRDEHELMAVRLHVAADEAETIAAAEELGMRLSVRLREFVARGGIRVDALVYEVLNPHWEVPDA
jgi:RimJ/RimL family protein N-acetyltransferase